MTVYSIVHCIMLDVGNCNWQGIGVLQQVERICYSLLINLKSFSRVHVKGAKQLAPIKPPLSPAKVHWLSHSSTLGITWLASLPSTMIMIADVTWLYWVSMRGSIWFFLYEKEKENRLLSRVYCAITRGRFIYLD